MKKFLAVVKREYVQRVRAKMFIVSTILLPVVMSLFGLVPAIILSIDAGSALRIAVVDQTGRMYQQVNEALVNDASDQGGAPGGRRGYSNFLLEQVSLLEGNDKIREELARRLREKEIDGYLVLPANLLDNGQPEFFNRNPGDVVSRRILQSALNR